MKSYIERRYDLDWVRVIAILMLFLFHCARLFDYDPWHLKNAETSLALAAYNHFFNYWGMQLLFLVAGAAAWFSLGARKKGPFVKERVLRLLVPLIFGMLLIVPPQVYLERIYEGQFTGSFFQFYPHFFEGTYSGSYAGTGNLSWHHLWFLAYLFTFTLLALPLFLWLRKPAGEKLISKLADYTRKPGIIFLYALPLWIFLSSLMPLFPGGEQNLVMDWAFFLYYITFFIYGYLFCADGRFWQAVDRHKVWALIMALMMTAADAYVELSERVPPLGYSPANILFTCLRCFTTWFWILAILGYARKFLSFTNRFLKYGNEAVLPFYILHQTIIIIIGYFVIQWDINVYLKYLIVATLSFATIMLLYEGIKRTNATRFIFGMRLKKKQPNAVPSTIGGSD